MKKESKKSAKESLLFYTFVKTMDDFSPQEGIEIIKSIKLLQCQY